LGLDIDQLIVLAILVGTDYNPGGVKGIGPKTGLKLVKEFSDFDGVFEKANWKEHFPDLDWKEIFYTIKNIPTIDDYNLEWGVVNEKELVKFLIKEHDFSEERVKTKLQKLLKEKEKQKQTGLGSFF
jgi:flap endonuclease-1